MKVRTNVISGALLEKTGRVLDQGAQQVIQTVKLASQQADQVSTGFLRRSSAVYRCLSSSLK